MISRILTVSLLMVLLLISCNSKQQQSQAESTPDDINDYPDIILKLTDGQEIEARQLSGGNIFVLFQPDCDHCQNEAIEIEQRLEQFRDYTIYFITSAPMQNIVDFAKNFNLYSRDGVQFAWTSTEGVLDHYGPIQVPSIYIYSGKRLKTHFNGQTDMENFLRAL